MNIQDTKIELENVNENQALSRIVLMQKGLMVKYKEIENMPFWPMPFNSKNSQLWFKEFMWRVHEELSEAREALHQADDLQGMLDEETLRLKRQHINHFWEELSDALHFLVELGIMSDFDFESIDIELMSGISGNSSIVGDIYLERKPIATNFIFEVGYLCDFMSSLSYFLGLAGNTLKMKRWKQTEVLSDKKQFDKHYGNALQCFFRLCSSQGFAAPHVLHLYMMKHKVNEWRQQTKY